MSSRYQYVKFEYTADDGTVLTRSQRFFKDNNGNLVIAIPQFFQERIVASSRPKDVVWGQGNSKLRKTVVQYINSNDVKSQLTLTIPQNPNQQILISLQELKKLCDETFSPLKYCFNYRGEARE